MLELVLVIPGGKESGSSSGSTVLSRRRRRPSVQPRPGTARTVLGPAEAKRTVVCSSPYTSRGQSDKDG